MEEEKSYKKLIIFGVVGFIILLLLAGSIRFTGTGSRRVLVRFGKATGRVMGEGLGFKVPLIDGTVVMNIRTQTIRFDNERGKGDQTEASSMFAASKDLQDVQLAAVINYHLKESSTVDVYRKYGTQKTYEDNILTPIIRETVKSKSALFTAEELVTKRAEFASIVTDTLTTKFAESDIVFERFSVVNFQFSDAFSKSIEEKQVAQQDAQRAEYHLAQSRKEAEAIKVQAEALKENPDLVQWEAVKKWDGHMPQVTGGAVPFININK